MLRFKNTSEQDQPMYLSKALKEQSRVVVEWAAIEAQNRALSDVRYRKVLEYAVSDRQNKNSRFIAIYLDQLNEVEGHK